MDTSWILTSSKNPKMKNKQKAKRTANDVTIATMSFSHLNNSIVIHEQTNQVSFFFHHQIKDFCYFFMTSIH